MDADNLDKLDAVIGAMTPGEWKVDDLFTEVGPFVYVEHEADFNRAPFGRIEADLKAIATLRNVAPELLAVVRAMRAIRDGDWWEVRHKDVQRGANALDALDAKLAEVLR